MGGKRNYFGTDGIRGTVGEGPITADFVMRLGWAVGKVFGARAKKGRKLVLIGKDTRVSGYMFESALQAGLIASGVDVGLLGPMPTPAIAYLTRTFHAQAGIVISASHNPFQDNGIKFFGPDGYKLPDEVEEEIEHYLDQPMVTEQSSELGRAERIADAAGRYIEFCKAVLPRDFELTGMRIVVDCANGATYHIAPNVLKELGAAEVIEMGVTPNGVNINLNCGSTKPAEIQRAVVDQGADLGVAFDGDGDRLIFVDHRGELVDGDEILYIIANHRQQSGFGCNGVAGTLMSNFGLEKAFQQMDVPFHRAKVGDRYVIETMKKQGWTLGGENSGHIVCSDVTTTGDGIVSAMLVLHALSDSGLTLHELKQGMSKYPQTMINVRINEKVNLDDYPAIADAVSAAEAELSTTGRVLLRPSGTEPLIRVMVEGEDKTLVDRLAEQVAAVVETTLCPEEV
ncbi:phosphoglucosamine mutase [bacterium SCSIO 12696]|nr:phosphoglucosamine mutase [bacterium SCSIO 12696]